MNCDTYLSMLETLPVEELAYGDAREHAANCRDCDRVTRVVTERERNMLMAFGELHPPCRQDQIAARALVLSRRRTIALYYRIALGVATAATILFMIMSRRTVAPAPTASVSETFRLQCLSPEQALEILRPYDRRASACRRGPTHRWVSSESSRPRRRWSECDAVLDRYDTPAESQCGVQLTVPKAAKVP